MTFKDYYKNLGIGKAATPAQIKKAYRGLANKYHPDKAKGDKAAEEKFKEINEANEVLSDPVKRKNTISLARIGSTMRKLERSLGDLTGRSTRIEEADNRTGLAQENPARCLRTQVSAISLRCSLDSTVASSNNGGALSSRVRT